MVFGCAVAASISIGTAWTHAASAQTPISKTARLIVGFPPGGVSDSVARHLADRLRGTYAPTVIVDNRPGAGGRISAEAVKNAEPDGSTMLVTPSPMITIYPHLYRQLSYDPLRDLAPVMNLGSYPVVLVGGPALPADVKTPRELVRWAKANPNQASYGTSAAGSTLHFTGVMLAKAGEVEMTHIPFKGGGPVAQALLGAQIPMAFVTPSTVVSHLRAGKLRALATSGAERSSMLPDVPTFKEAGFADIKVDDWIAVFVPAKTPAALIAKLNAALRDALKTPELTDAFAKLMVELVPPQSPEEFGRQVLAELTMWGPIVKASGFIGED